MVQCALPDGRLIEQACPRRAWAPAPEIGEKILIWYDSADPSEVLVYRRGGRRSDALFIVTGCVLLGVGLAVAVFGT